MNAPTGFVVLYKPVGPGSQGLLGAVKRLAGTRRVGHAGTLDPFASGVLPVAVGRATRLVDQLHTFPKTYRAVVRLGIETSTLDVEGEVTRREQPPRLTPEAVGEALAAFVGTIRQAPPIYSAAKVGGRRAYELARAGAEVELDDREVTIHALTLLSLSEDRLAMEVCCSTGTYVRSLGRDIAAALGTVAHLSRLVRTRVGPFGIDGALTADEMVAIAGRLGLDAVLHAPDEVLLDLPAVALSPEECVAAVQGRLLPWSSDRPGVGQRVRAYDGGGRLLCLLERTKDGLAPRLLLQ